MDVIIQVLATDSTVVCHTHIREMSTGPEDLWVYGADNVLGGCLIEEVVWILLLLQVGSRQWFFLPAAIVLWVTVSPGEVVWFSMDEDMFYTDKFSTHVCSSLFSDFSDWYFSREKMSEKFDVSLSQTHWQWTIGVMLLEHTGTTLCHFFSPSEEKDYL